MVKQGDDLGAWGTDDDFIGPLSAVAHELKVPLANVRYFAKLLLDEQSALSEAQRQTYLKRLLITTERSLDNINGLTASLRNDQMELELHPVNVAQVFEDVLHELSPLAQELSQSLHFKRPRQSPLALASQPLLKTALTNLCDNALRHNQANQPVLLAISQPGSKVVLNVTDSGPRISAAAFKQLKSRLGNQLYPLGSRVGSSGLGLFIAHRLSQAMGGNLQLTRHHQAGLTFALKLQPSSQLNLF